MIDRLDAVERMVRGLGGLAALLAGAHVLPGVISSSRTDGRAVGRPEAVLSPRRLALVSLGWFGAAAILWRPLPLPLRARQRLVLLIVGAPLYFLGLGLAISGRLALGSSYRVSSGAGVRLARHHRLVVSGPYSVIRHPMYVGLALAAIGGLLVYRTWATLFFVVELPSLLLRARLEDQVLAAEFGAAWTAYRDRVPGWVPRLALDRRLGRAP